MTGIFSTREVPPSAIDPAVCGQIEQLLLPLWSANLMAPEVAAEQERLGLAPHERYFATRVAPLGAVGVPVVTATFFNFSPAAISTSIPAVWEKATPTQLLDAQRAGITIALDRAFAGLDRSVLEEAATLLRTVADAATARPEGRPLFAGYASLPWPDETKLVLWHAHYLLREFRGDGHIAVLVAAGLSGREALAVHIAMAPFLSQIFLATRGWSDEEWRATLDKLRRDDWLTGDDDLTLTASGQERRDAIEARTNDLNVPAYAAIGPQGCERLLELAMPIAEALRAAGLAFPFRP